MKDCIFCEIYKNKSSDNSIFYEDKYFYAGFDKFPVSPGHAEIIPIRHVKSILDLCYDEWAQLHSALSNVIEDIKTTDLKKLYNKFLQNPLNEKSQEFCEKMLNHPQLEYSFNDYNIGINEGEAAGRTIPHLHIHVIPRFPGDVKDHVGGVRHIIPGMGNYKK